MIYPNDAWKGNWDLFITLILIFTCLATPYLISFSEDAETLAWQIINSAVDFFFLIDIFFNFNQAYFNDDFIIQENRKQIACQYIKGWFTIDVAAILPMDYIIVNKDKGSGGASMNNKMLRLSKIGRMYKLIKLTRLLRILKIVKEKSRILKQIQTIMKIGAGFERLFFFIMCSFMVCHIISCLWVFMAKISSGDCKDGEECETPTWIAGSYDVDPMNYAKNSHSHLYLISLYYVITTMTTVGYGDISPSKINAIEMLFGILLMIGGVVAFSFASATLTSILSTYDNQNADF